MRSDGSPTKKPPQIRLFSDLPGRVHLLAANVRRPGSVSARCAKMLYERWAAQRVPVGFQNTKDHRLSPTGSPVTTRRRSRRTHTPTGDRTTSKDFSGRQFDMKKVLFRPGPNCRGLISARRPNCRIVRWDNVVLFRAADLIVKLSRGHIFTTTTPL